MRRDVMFIILAFALAIGFIVASIGYVLTYEILGDEQFIVVVNYNNTTYMCTVTKTSVAFKADCMQILDK